MTILSGFRKTIVFHQLLTDGSSQQKQRNLWQPFTGEIDVSQMGNEVAYLYVRDGAGNVSAAAQIDLAGQQLFLPLVTK
ncbi:MAG: hypothetical protein DYG89_01115 [Caldilinea sp. CFX5]|nr:hypothetical protein [Caldilinea sp. CFX5]